MSSHRDSILPGAFLVALAVLTVPPLASVAAAQQSLVPTSGAKRSARDGAADSSLTLAGAVASLATGGADGSPDDVLPAVVTRVDPQGFAVVRVPVPSLLDDGNQLSYAVLSTGVVTIIGARQGLVAPGRPDADGQRSVLLTVGVPKQAPAGRSEVARVRFAGAGHAPVLVPVELEIARRRRVLTEALQTRRGARPGDRLEIPFRITNAGNDRDSLTLAIEAPAGWHLHAGSMPSSIVLGVNQVRRLTMRLVVPRTAHGGSERVRLIVTGGGEERSRAEAAVEVSADRRLRAGPRVEAGVSTVAGGGSEGTTVVDVDIRGALTDSVAIFARAASRQRVASADGRALSRVGYFGGPPYVSLVAPRWRVDAGGVRVGFTDLTGLGVGGRGADAMIRNAQWSIAAAGARPEGGSTGSRGALAGVQAGKLVEGVWVTAAATHLEDRQLFARRLDAFGLGASVAAPYDALLAGELAYRRFGDGSGVGATARLDRRTRRDNVMITMTRAPGGSAAFARAATELSLAASREVSNRFSLSGGAWSSGDRNSTFRDLSASGWSVAPRFGITDRTSITLDATRSRSDAATATSSFGTTEMRTGATVRAYLPSLYLSSGASVGAVERRTSAGAVFASSASRAVWSSAAGVYGGYGVVDLTSRIERNGAGSGYEPRRNETVLRAESRPRPVGRVDVLVRGEAQRYGWFGDRPSVTAIRAGMSVLFPLQLELTVDSERNPLFAPGSGGPRWITSARLARAVTLARLGAAGDMDGVVYEDLNANGIRDHGEPPYAGALVQYGERTVPSDSRGRYRILGASTGTLPRLDVRSLPEGWVLTQAPVQAGTGRGRDFGVVPTSELEVRLVVEPADGGRLPVVRLGAATVSLREALGRTWEMSLDSAGVGVLDALPPGTYTIEVDLRRLGEPLRVDGELPTITTTATRSHQRVTITLRPRPLRIWRPTAPATVPPAADAPTSMPSSTTPGALRLPAAVPMATPLSTSPSAPATASIADASAFEPIVTERSIAKQPWTANPGITIAIDPTTEPLPASLGYYEGHPLLGYVVRRNDTLRRLATRFLHDEMRWPTIYRINRAQIRHPDLILTGQELRLYQLEPARTETSPSVAPAPAAPSGATAKPGRTPR